MKIIFICQGNICRSPCAEILLKKELEDYGILSHYDVTSRALEPYEEGMDIDSRMKEVLEEHGIDVPFHSSKMLLEQEEKEADLLVVMEHQQIEQVREIGDDYDSHKIHRLASYTAAPHDIADPYYSGDFETAYMEIKEGCSALALRLLDKLN